MIHDDYKHLGKWWIGEDLPPGGTLGHGREVGTLGDGRGTLGHGRCTLEMEVKRRREVCEWEW